MKSSLTSQKKLWSSSPQNHWIQPKLSSSLNYDSSLIFNYILSLNFNSNQQSKYLFFFYLFIVLLAYSNTTFVIVQRFGIYWGISFSLFLFLIRIVLYLFRFWYFRWRFRMGYLFKFWKTYWLLYFYVFFFLKLVKDIFLLDEILFYCDFDSSLILFARLGCPFSLIHRQASESFVGLVQLLFHFKQLLFSDWSCLFSLNHLLFFEFYRFFSQFLSSLG